MLTGKESSMSYESIKKTNDMVVKAGAGKFNPSKLNNQTLSPMESASVKKMQASLQAKQRPAHGPVPVNAKKGVDGHSRH